MSVWIIWLIPSSATTTLWKEVYNSALGTSIINLKPKEMHTRGNFSHFLLHGFFGRGFREFWMLWVFIAGDDFKNTAGHVRCPLWIDKWAKHILCYVQEQGEDSIMRGLSQIFCLATISHCDEIISEVSKPPECQWFRAWSRH